MWFAFVVVGIGLGWSLIFPEKPIAKDRANGRYFDAECGVIILNNGIIASGKMKAEYALQRDKNGLFALTNYLVGIKIKGQSCVVSSDRSKYALYLRFDNSEHPTAVTLWNMDEPATVTFRRQLNPEVR